MTEIADLTKFKIMCITGRIIGLNSQSASMRMTVRVLLDQEGLMRSAARRVDRRHSGMPADEDDDDYDDDDDEAEDVDDENFKKRAKNDPDVVVVNKQKYNECMENGKALTYAYVLTFDVAQLEFMAAHISYIFIRKVPPADDTGDAARKPKIPVQHLRLVGFSRDKKSMPTSRFMMNQLMRINPASRRVSHNITADKSSAFSGVIVNPFDYGKIKNADLRTRCCRIFWNTFRIGSYYSMYLLLSQYKQLTYSDDTIYAIHRSMQEQEGFDAFFFSIYHQPALVDPDLLQKNAFVYATMNAVRASRLWCAFYRKSLYTCNFLWSIPEDLFDMEKSDVERAMGYLREHNLVQAIVPPENEPVRLYVPAIVYKDAMRIMQLLFGAAADHICFIVGSVHDASEHSVDFCNSHGVDYPPLAERLVITPTSEGAVRWQRELGCRVCHAKPHTKFTSDESNAEKTQIAIIDSAHQMSLHTLRDVLDALMLRRDSVDDIPLIYICGYPTRKRIDERWGACFFFDELVSSGLELRIVNKLPLVTRDMLELGKTGPVHVDAAGHLQLRMRVVEDEKEALRCVQKMRDMVGEVIVLFTSVVGANIPQKLPVSYTIAKGRYHIDDCGVQHCVNDLRAIDGMSLRDVAVPDTYQGLVRYTFAEETKQTMHNAGVDQIWPMTPMLACGQNFVPMDNVVLVVNSPFLSRNDLNAALALAKSRLFIVSLPEFWEKSSIYEGGVRENLAVHLRAEMLAYPVPDPVVTAPQPDNESETSKQSSAESPPLSDSESSDSEPQIAVLERRPKEEKKKKKKKKRKEHRHDENPDDVLPADDEASDAPQMEPPAEQPRKKKLRKRQESEDEQDDAGAVDFAQPAALPKRKNVVVDDDDD